MERVKVGIVGCGFISGAYLRTAPLFDILDVKACADLDMDAAGARAREARVAAVAGSAVPPKVTSFLPSCPRFSSRCCSF